MLTHPRRWFVTFLVRTPIYTLTGIRPRPAIILIIPLIIKKVLYFYVNPSISFRDSLAPAKCSLAVCDRLIKPITTRFVQAEKGVSVHRQ
jgi:hypothetical protein